jgi:hypothetical protein
MRSPPASGSDNRRRAQSNVESVAGLASSCRISLPQTFQHTKRRFMSTRDRWTVYPLIFLALGAALRSKVTSTVEVDTVTACSIEAAQQIKAVQMTAKSIVVSEDLQISGTDGKPRIRMGTTKANTGAIEIYGRDGNIVAALTVDPESDRATLRLQTAEGTPQVTLSSDGDGGILESYSKTGEPRVLIHTSPEGGMVATVDAAGHVRIEYGRAAGKSDAAAEPSDLKAEQPARGAD